MDESQRLLLNQMIKTNNVEDQTELIRKLKHSTILRNDVINMMVIKAKHRNDPEQLKMECISECQFIYKYYTDIFNKIKNDEIDIEMFNNFLNVLEKIENGELDQHEGSFLIGKLLKELYIDSALKKSEMLDKKYSEEPSRETEIRVSSFPELTWSKFKKNKINLGYVNK